MTPEQVLCYLGSRIVAETEEALTIEVAPDARVEVPRERFLPWLERRMETRQTHKNAHIGGSGVAWARPRVAR
jgi:hypothetical protein